MRAITMDQQFVSKEATESLIDMVRELASELDLHYEDDDFFALKPTIEVMSRAVRIIQAQGYPAPEVYEHVIRRYRRHHQ